MVVHGVRSGRTLLFPDRIHDLEGRFASITAR
jgi:hypothetical protein